ncbi:ABC-2 type transport system ATP-binding protein [Brevibacterium sanguinis]|uniref:ABC-2 type transport system ATP-binding protein n=2 Tax=Brevibacterium TaxID=1696 RepID=A0A366IGZ3_9MICO|nr:MULTISPECIES: ATP-binding cassette domain-containing protein [Brevibacterium]RBP62903.1 ABC-2 type transport system ATP-binding protein [Brevibacterium sanguinis]RBP69552.1 ABC-2 type transport system ATP-binding protein [Brevibacterium celere]
MSELAIHTTGLTKSYRSKQVLSGIDLRIPRGQVFALLGPNGAGKTTTVNILSTLQRPDSGSAHVFGHDIVTEATRVRELIGVTGQFSAVDGLLTGRENLAMMAAFTHVPKAEQRSRVDELLDRFDLAEAGKKVASTYSGGMRRKLDLAMTLIARPRLVFLDEPTTGLDPRSRRTMWDIVGELVADGIGIFLTTQYLEEADVLADRIAMLDNGGIVAEGTPAELKRQMPGGHVRLEFATGDDLDRARRLWTDASAEAAELSLDVPGDGSVKHIRHLLTRLEGEGIEPRNLSVVSPGIDDVFFALTGHRPESGNDTTAHTVAEETEAPATATASAPAAGIDATIPDARTDKEISR